MNKTIFPKTSIRKLFASSMSKMYQKEVPKYKLLLDIIKEINEEVARENPIVLKQLGLTLDRINEERHGAIRVGNFEELKNVAKIFSVMGMYPCNYYDLTIAGHPIHSTAFRPIDRKELAKNPFRVFTSVLREDLLPENIKDEVKKALKKREIFNKRVLTLCKINEKEGGLNKDEAEEFILEATKTFKWHKEANISFELYNKLKDFSPIAADIVGFKGPHINHLAPVCIDIDKSFSKMEEKNLETIDNIQGPPKRDVPILLRQTSFKAIEESTVFYTEDRKKVSDKHRARFGEIECRGIALTKKGRELYDELLIEVTKKSKENNLTIYKEILESVFKIFPKELKELREKKLAFFHYHVTKTGHLAKEEGKDMPNDLDKLIKLNYISFTGIIYEDFLPVSAAGIFDSNLDKNTNKVELSFKTIDEYREYEKLMKKNFEKGLSFKTIDTFKKYAEEEEESIKNCFIQLS